MMTDKSKNDHPKSSANAQKPKSQGGAGSEGEIQVESSEAFVDFGTVASIREGASGVIPITALPDVADTPSVVSWADVIRQQKEFSQGSAPPSGSPIKIDSFSDIDLKKQFDAMMPKSSFPGMEDFSANVFYGSEAMDLAFQNADSGFHNQSSKVNLQPAESVDPLTGSRVHLGSDSHIDKNAANSGNISFTINQPPSDAAGSIPIPSDDDFALGRLVSEDYPVFADGEADNSALAEELRKSSAAFRGEDIFGDSFAPEGDAPPSSHLQNILFGDEMPSGKKFGANIHGDEADIGVLPDYGSEGEDPSAALRSSILDVLLTNPNDDPFSASSSNVFGPSGPVHSMDSPDDSAFSPFGPSHADQNSVHDANPRKSSADYYLPEAAAMAGSPRNSHPDIDLPNWMAGDAQGPQDENRAAEQISLNAESGRSNQPDSSDGEYEGEGSVDIYADRPLESELTASGTFKVSDADLELAKLRQKILESSAVDLSSNPSFNSFRLGKKRTPTPQPDSGTAMPFGAAATAAKGPAYAEPVARFAPEPDSGHIDVNTPSENEVDNSMIRRLEEMASQEDFVLGESGLLGNQQHLRDAFPKADAPGAPNKMSSDTRLATKDVRKTDSQPVPRDARLASKDVRKTDSQPVSRPPEKAQTPFRSNVTPAELEVEQPEEARKSRSGLLWGGLAGLLVGAGGVFGAYQGGLLHEPGHNNMVKQLNGTKSMLQEQSAAAEQLRDQETAFKSLFAQLNVDSPKAAVAAFATLQKSQDAAVKESAANAAKLKDASAKLATANQDANLRKAEYDKAAKELLDAKENAALLTGKAKTASDEVAQLKLDLQKMPKVDKELQAKYDAAVAAATQASQKEAALAAQMTASQMKLTEAEKAKTDADAKAADLGRKYDQATASMKQIEDQLVKGEIVKPGADPKALSEGIKTLFARGANAPEAIKAMEKQVADLNAKVTAADAKVAMAQTKSQAEIDRAMAEAGKAKADLLKARNDLASADKSAKEEQARLTASFQKQMQAMQDKLAAGGTGAGGGSMDAWLAALRNSANKTEAALALADANRIIADPAGREDSKVKAMAVKALAYKVQGDSTSAKTAFVETQKMPAFKPEQSWAKDFAATLAPLNDATAAISAIKPTDSPKSQLQQLDEAIVNLGNQPSVQVGQLHARRGLLKVDAGSFEEAKQDADLAIRFGALADGQFVLARAMERQGHWAEAEKGYRAVIGMDKADPSLKRQAMLGLGRVLNHLSASPPRSTSESPSPKTLSRDDLAPQILMAIMLNSVVFQDPSGDQLAESIKLADKLIAEGENLGHLIKADALSRQGRFAEALKAYSAGIDKLKVLPAEYEGVLDRIVTGLPIPQRIEVRVVVPAAVANRTIDNRRNADRLYADGLQSFFGHNYSQAEEAFSRAIAENDSDARLYYFLGLSRLSQGRADQAYDDFRVGATLERKGNPTSKTVNQSLERIQGDRRQTLNQYRP